MSSSDDENPLAEVYDEDNLLNMVIPSKPEPCMKTDGTGARLMIKEIVVTNFKSYYGTQKIGPFHKNFSAIVGPNGSGKSNVIDSLLFVFGYKASKIRSKKLSVLIHSSSGKDNINSCTVEILFQKIIDKDGGDFDIVPGSEFSVSRTAYKNNSSTYTMNGKVMSIKEIAKRLRDVGIDLVHNRFLILQGEVEQIAMMKPKALNANDEGMLEYLEDIIGSSRFKVPIENLGEKLDKLSAERSQQTQRVKAAEKEKQAMEGPVREMISFLRTENQVALIKNKLYHIKMFKFIQQISTMQPERDSIEEQKTKVEAELKELLELRKTKDSDIHKIEGEKDKTVRELEKVQRELTELEGKETKRKNDLKRAAADLIKLMNDLEKEKKKLKDIQSIPEKSAAKIEILRESVVELHKTEDENQKQVDENLPRFESKTMEDKAKKAMLEEELGVLKQAENDASSKLTLAQEELQILMADEQKEKKRVYDLSTQLNDAKELLEKKSTEYADIKAALPKSQDALRLAREQVPLIKEEEDKLADDVSQLRMKLADEKLAASHGMQGSERHKALMKAKSSGILPGLLGRLGDLGGIDKKYDAAISTTTAALDSYVVETTDDGHAAIDFLVKNNFGRTNFITIDKTSEYKGNMDPPPGKKFPALRLFDLLEISDPRLRKVFYSTLMDTMVVETLKEAQDISDKYLGTRIVTLQGQVIDSSGTVSGGGSPKYGLIGNKVKVDTTKETKDTAERIARYSKELDDKTSKLQDITSRMRQTEQRIYTLSNDVNKLNTQNRILSNEVQVLTVKISNLEKQLENQQEQAARCVADEAIVQAKTEEINRLTQLRNKANEEVDTVQVKVDEVQSKIDAIHKDLIKKYADEVQLARDRRTQAEKDMAKEQSAINAASRNHRKAEERIAQIEKDYSDKKSIEEKLSDDEDLFTKEIHRLHSKKTELEANIKEMEDLLKEARKKNSSMDQEELRLQKTIKETVEKVEEMDCQLKALGSELAGTKRQIASLKLNRIKELDVLPEKVRQRDEKEYYLDETVREEEEHLKKQKEKQGGLDDNIDDGALPVLTEDDLKDVDREDLKFQLNSLEEKVLANKKDINMNIIHDFTIKVKRFEHERELLEVAKKKYSDHLSFQDNLKKQRLSEFMEGFERIGLALKEMYQMITLGGDAALDLKDSMDPFSEGIQFMVRPPKKSWKNIENLSGGEKTLSSLSLVFALHHYRPTPLYVMDEIDAALDFRNVSIIGHYIKDRTKNAQFIIISLRNNMFELGDRLIGIYKTFDCTKNVVVDPAQVIEESKKITKALETVCKGKENHPSGEEKNSEKVDDVERSDHNRKVRSSSSDISLPRKRVSAGSPPNTIGKKPDHRPSPRPSKRVGDRVRVEKRDADQ